MPFTQLEPEHDALPALWVPRSSVQINVAPSPHAQDPEPLVDEIDLDIQDAELLPMIDNLPVVPKTIIAVIPACNEADTIVATVESLLAQDRPVDGIVIVVNNSTDNTEAVVRGKYQGHPSVRMLVMEHNPDKKVGALKFGWKALKSIPGGFDYFLGVDGDTVLEPSALGDLEREMEKDSKLGGLSARYTFDPKLGRTRSERFLIRLQRLEFASSGMDTMYRKRNTYVLGGQATLFRASAMDDVEGTEKLHSPWDPDDEVEDMGLTWHMKEQGWLTKVSASARAYAGPMFTWNSLYHQRRKWDGGTLRLLFKTKPSVSAQVWGLQLRNMLDVFMRIGFAVLLAASLTLHIYQWSWWWLIPPAVAMLLNWKIARKVPGRSLLDTILAVTLLPVEMYLVFRLFIWSISLIKTITGSRKDLWEKQYTAERKAS